MKETLEDLAVFGGAPAFAEKLHVGRPNVGDRKRLIERINDILDRRWFTNNGSCVQELEQRIADYAGVKHCVTMCNGTVALEIAIRALGLKGEVIVPSLTFIATAHALQWQEIKPVFCDVRSDNYTIDPARVADMVTPDTTGIIGVHLWGRSCDAQALADVAEEYDLKLLFDAAHAFGCSHKGRMIGNFGNAEVFSFHATKFFNTFEGGAVVTNDDELASKVRLMKNFGFAGPDNVVYIGTNGKMNEVSAAMGLTCFESLKDFIDLNHQNYMRYKESLKGIPGISLMPYEPTEKNNFQYIILDIDKQTFGIGRDMLVEILHAENILARRYFYPGCHRMEPYKSCYPHAGLLLPETERIVERVISLPTGSAINRNHIDRICQLVRYLSEHNYEVTEKLHYSSAKEPAAIS